MIIPHRELEWARSDPTGYVEHLRAKAEGKKGGGGGGFYGFWKFAAMHYHKLSGDREAAVNHFTQMVRNNLNDTSKNRAKLEIYVEHLNAYFDDYESRGYYPFQRYKRVITDLGPNVRMSGQFPRLDVVLTGGYAAFLFSRNCEGWDKELRFPLVQHRLSQELGCAPQEVATGVYCLEAQEHVSLSFSQTQIDEAVKEAGEIAQTLQRLVGGLNS